MGNQRFFCRKDFLSSNTFDLWYKHVWKQSYKPSMKRSTSFFAICMLLNTVALSQAGTLDLSFGDSGFVKTRTAALGSEEAHSLQIQNDGKIISAGTVYHYGYIADFLLTRYKIDGRLDSAFGVDGKVISDFGDYEDGASVAIQPDGKIVIAGYTGENLPSDFLIARYRNNGEADSSFGNNGTTIVDFQNIDRATAIAIQADGKIVVAGCSYDNIFQANGDIAVVRLDANGEPDSTFGENGKILRASETAQEDCSLAIQKDGKIITAGNSRGDFILLRFETNGKIDSSFGTDGEAITDFGDNDWIESIALQDDGKIVATGISGYQNAVLARYLQTGLLDSAFKNGKILTSGYGSVGSSVAIQQDGKIIVGGYLWVDNYDCYMLRFDQDGTADSSFGAAGKVFSDFGHYDLFYSVAIQNDAKIVAAGYTGHYLLAARYNADGVLASGTVNLKASLVGNNVNVEWTAVNETNVSQYNVERSVDGKIFITIGNVKAIGNGQTKIDYNYTDFSPAIGDNFYRIESLSKDGARKYTGVVKVNFVSASSSIVLSPNPVTDILQIQGLSPSMKQFPYLM